jgi:hypothetical protein
MAGNGDRFDRGDISREMGRGAREGEAEGVEADVERKYEDTSVPSPALDVFLAPLNGFSMDPSLRRTLGMSGGCSSESRPDDRGLRSLESLDGGTRTRSNTRESSLGGSSSVRSMSGSVVGGEKGKLVCYIYHQVRSRNETKVKGKGLT